MICTNQNCIFFFKSVDINQTKPHIEFWDRFSLYNGRHCIKVLDNVTFTAHNFQKCFMEFLSPDSLFYTD